MAQGKPPPEVEQEVQKYQALQGEVQELNASRGQFLQQANENELVKQELDLLSDGAPVYKLIGPVLMQQDLDDAKQNVAKRLDFIKGEIEKVDVVIQDKQKAQNEIGEKVMAMQQEMRATAAQEAQKVYEEAAGGAGPGS